MRKCNQCKFWCPMQVTAMGEEAGSCLNPSATVYANNGPVWPVERIPYLVGKDKACYMFEQEESYAKVS